MSDAGERTGKEGDTDFGTHCDVDGLKKLVPRDWSTRKMREGEAGRCVSDPAGRTLVSSVFGQGDNRGKTRGGLRERRGYDGEGWWDEEGTRREG